MTIEKSISELLDGVREAYLEDQLSKGIYSSGISAKSLRTEVKETEGTLYGAKYFIQQKQGRKPGKFPPISAIFAWIKLKGIKPRDNKTSERQLAFIFAKKIATSGTDIFQKKRPALNVDEKIKSLLEIFKEQIKTNVFTVLK